jgi:hypothetical protein
MVPHLFPCPFQAFNTLSSQHLRAINFFIVVKFGNLIINNSIDVHMLISFLCLLPLDIGTLWSLRTVRRTLLRLCTFELPAPEDKVSSLALIKSAVSVPDLEHKCSQALRLMRICACHHTVLPSSRVPRWHGPGNASEQPLPACDCGWGSFDTSTVPTFRGSCFRNGSHGFTSMHAAATVGEVVGNATKWPVNLNEFDIEVGINLCIQHQHNYAALHGVLYFSLLQIVVVISNGKGLVGISLSSHDLDACKRRRPFVGSHPSPLKPR